ncbi:hypothetical protein M3Y99_01585700 [Aphelenchoides fujianensis]|nr:hypothetical protein M3Y99_01585700 [Aphelenchoides fujianensis]
MEAGTSANPPQRPVEIIRANSDGEEVAGEWNEEPGVVCFKCPVCDLRFSCWSLLNAHARAHDSDDQFVCSLCGIRRPTAAERNQHEERVHAYARYISHRERKEASRIGVMKMVTLRNVGSNFDAIQQAVREELQRTIVVAPSSPPQAASPKKRPLASSLPIAAKRVRVSNVAEVVTIEDSDEEQLPEDLNVPAPNSEPTANRKRTRPSCSTCGVTANSRALMRQHEAAHERRFEWECAVCRTTYRRFSERNAHEITLHGFQRAAADKCRKEAVRIWKSQVGRLYNVGTKLVEVQQKALPSAFRWPAGDRNATVAELQAAIDRKADKPLHFDEGCPHCGFKAKNYLNFNLHVAAHTSAHSFLCSLCGTR